LKAEGTASRRPFHASRCHPVVPATGYVGPFGVSGWSRAGIGAEGLVVLPWQQGRTVEWRRLAGAVADPRTGDGVADDMARRAHALGLSTPRIWRDAAPPRSKRAVRLCTRLVRSQALGKLTFRTKGSRRRDAPSARRQGRALFVRTQGLWRWWHPPRPETDASLRLTLRRPAIGAAEAEFAIGQPRDRRGHDQTGMRGLEPSPTCGGLPPSEPWIAMVGRRCSGSAPGARRVCADAAGHSTAR